MKLINKRAKRDYELFETIEAGVSLLGSEVKSLKMGRGELGSSFVRIRDGEAWLTGLNIPPYAHLSDPSRYDPLRQRKLLLHKKEIVGLSVKMKTKNLTLIPLSVYTRGPRVKVELALAKSRKEYQKKEIKKKKDIQRLIEIETRGKV